MFKFRVLAFVVIAAAGLAGCTQSVSLSTKAESLVEKSQWTIETFKQNQEQSMQMFRDMLRDAHGVVVFPGALKAGFLVGAEYGDGVLVAREPGGGWGYPAFYTMGAGSVGLQIGGQVSEIVLILRSEKAVQAIIKHQAKLGADLEVTAGTIGAGMEGSTTTAMGVDVVAFSRATGLFGGASVEGAVLAKRNDLNESFYGPGATPQTIALENRHQNPKADPLRAVLAVP